jgi:hypothetical protein
MELPIIFALAVSVIIIAYLAYTTITGGSKEAPNIPRPVNERAEVVQVCAQILFSH